MAATTIEGKIEEALFARLRDLVLTPALSIAWPNVKFDNPDTGLWLEVSMFEAPTEEITINANGANKYQGFLQVVVVGRSNSGLSGAKDVAGMVVDWFRRGTILDNAGVRVWIVQPPYVIPTVRDDPYTQTAVTIRYQVFGA